MEFRKAGAGTARGDVGVALRLLASWNNKPAETRFSAELNALTPDEKQGHKLDPATGAGHIGKVLVEAMEASLKGGDKDSAMLVFEKLWGYHKECALRWRGAVTYECSAGWCIADAGDEPTLVDGFSALGSVDESKRLVRRCRRFAAPESQ